jgi:CDP-glucose 4,6-dehydratase
VLRNPDAVRPWQHVLDVLWGYLMLAEALQRSPSSYGSAWNFGPSPGDEDSVRRLATRVTVGLGSGSVEVDPSPGGPEETDVLRLDASRARSELGWQPLLDADSCIAQTVRWYAQWMAGEDPAALCRRELLDYLACRS